MTIPVASSIPTAPATRRILHQQGLGTRAGTLRNRMLRRVVGLGALALALSIVHVWSRVKVLELRYAMTGIQQRVEELKKRVSQLELAVAARKAPERLEQVAKTALGMQLPAAGQVIVVKESDDGNPLVHNRDQDHDGR